MNQSFESADATKQVNCWEVGDIIMLSGGYRGHKEPLKVANYWVFCDRERFNEEFCRQINKAQPERRLPGFSKHDVD